MAHHQGMSLLALDNVLNGSPMQERFHADPRIQAAELLLQERVPQLVPLKNPPAETAAHVPFVRRAIAPPMRLYTTPHTLSPRAHLLSNGSYTVMVTNAGGGYSRRQQLALTRWREDITSDAWGSFVFVRDLDTGDVWSTTHQPSGREAEEYEATFSLDRAVWRRVDSGLETRTEVVVSPEDDAELRRVSITNNSHRARSLDLTSYAEVVLAPPAADLAHPAFSNLFIETTAVPEWDALLCTRRPRSGTDRVYLVHVLSGRGRIGAATEYETDRARFIGRGRTLANPAALSGGGPLSNTTGAVLDPIVSLRQSIRLPPGGTARLSFTTGICRQRGGRPAPHREVLRPPGGRARDRPGQHARADRAAAPRAHRRGHDAVPAARGPAALRRPAPAIAGGGAREPARTAGAVEVRHLRRSPHRAGDHRGRQPARRSSPTSSRPTSICAARAWPSTSSC